MRALRERTVLYLALGLAVSNESYCSKTLHTVAYSYSGLLTDRTPAGRHPAPVLSTRFWSINW